MFEGNKDYFVTNKRTFLLSKWWQIKSFPSNGLMVAMWKYHMCLEIIIVNNNFNYAYCWIDKIRFTVKEFLTVWWWIFFVIRWHWRLVGTEKSSELPQQWPQMLKCLNIKSTELKRLYRQRIWLPWLKQREEDGFTPRLLIVRSLEGSSYHHRWVEL